jgi:hypothetical protein
VIRKLPADSFEAYVAMGPERSYQAIATKYHCSKQAVTKKAAKERWQERLDEIEAEARRNSDKRVVQTLRDLNEKQLKLWQLVESRALQALRDHTLASAMDAAKALDLATKNIRLILGEATERTENIEQTVRREFDRFLTTASDDDWNGVDNPQQLDQELLGTDAAQPVPEHPLVLEERGSDDEAAAG